MQKVFFAIPAYKGIRCVPFFESLEATITCCQAQGWETSLSILERSCYVQVARNELVKTFLDSDCTDLFFLDDDISWDCKDALKLLRMPDDIVSGVYPYKTIEENYPVVIYTDEEGYPNVRPDGCIIAAMVPAGFLRIKRHVIQKMWDAYPSLRYFKPIGTAFIEYIDLFPQGVKAGRWVGEDYAFCDLWHGLGGEIIVVPDIDFIHHNDAAVPPEQSEFKGNYYDFLVRQPGGSGYVFPDIPPYSEIDIDGWLTTKEQIFLYEQACKYDSILEIGSYKGRSAAVFLSSKAKEVCCVDSWLPMKELTDDTIESAEQRYQEFLKNIEPYRGGNGRLKIIRSDSIEASHGFADKSLDMVFIDGDHDYEAFKADMAAWLPKANKLICGHDYSKIWPDVMRVVRETFGINNFKTAETIWYVEL